MKRFKTFTIESKKQELEEQLRQKLKNAAVGGVLGGVAALPFVGAYAAGKYQSLQANKPKTSVQMMHDAGPTAVDQKTPGGVNKPSSDDPYGGRFHEIVDMTGRFEGGSFKDGTSHTHADPIHGWKVPTNAGQTLHGLNDTQHAYLKQNNLKAEDIFKEGGSISTEHSHNLRRLRMEGDRSILVKTYTDFDSHPHQIKAILHDLAYNLGHRGLSKFKNFNAAVNNKKYKSAATHLKDSLYYKQTGNRAKTHVQTLSNL